MIGTEQRRLKVPPPLGEQPIKEGETKDRAPLDEKNKVYTDVNEDPAYRDLQKDITRRVNQDGQVEEARRSGKGFSDTWSRVAIREELYGMERFVADFPEKSQAYANRWKELVSQNPEVGSMNNLQWDKWCEEHPGSFNAMDECRRIARAVNRVERRKEEKKQYQSLKEADRQMELRNGTLGLPISHEEKQRIETGKLKLAEYQTRSVLENIKSSTSSELIGADDTELTRRQEKLKDLPFISSKDTKYLTDFEGDDAGFEYVETDKIVGTVSADFENWANEYQSRKGRVVEIAKNLLNPTEEGVEQIFHPKKANERIRLKKVLGPSGELFIVVEGTHRIAGCKLAQTHEIPAKVEDVSNLKEINTSDETLAGQWKRRIEKGLIKGEIRETESGTFSLEIKSQILPWMHLPDMEMIRFSRIYESVYSGSLDKLKIPKQALLDIVAYNHFMTGRYEEYEQMQNKKE